MQFRIHFLRVPPRNAEALKLFGFNFFLQAMHTQSQSIDGALIDIHLAPLKLSSEAAIPLQVRYHPHNPLHPLSPCTAQPNFHPDVKNFGLQLTPMLKLAKNRVISIAYIIEQVEEIVGVNDTIWNAVVFLSD